jgi:hypothetical protein
MERSTSHPSRDDTYLESGRPYGAPGLIFGLLTQDFILGYSHTVPSGTAAEIRVFHLSHTVPSGTAVEVRVFHLFE